MRLFEFCDLLVTRLVIRPLPAAVALLVIACGSPSDQGSDGDPPGSSTGGSLMDGTGSTDTGGNATGGTGPSSGGASGGAPTETGGTGGSPLDPDACTSGTDRPGAASCGPNDRGRLEETCVDQQWVETTTCIDNDICTDGSTRDGTTSCGSDNVYEQECVDGTWEDTANCITPPECVDSTTREGSTACGVNMNGFFDQECVGGAWEDTVTCVDPDECTNGASGQSPTSCGLNGRGNLERECVDGSWEDLTGSCTDPDVCTDGSHDYEGGTQFCGINGRGFYSLICNDGAWEDNYQNCQDPDVCLDETIIDSETTCGIMNNGYLKKECVEGAWEDLPDSCIDPDECGEAGQQCCAGRTCDSGLGCSTTGACDDPCELSFRMVRPQDTLIPGASIPSALADETQDHIWGRSVLTLLGVGGSDLYNLADYADGLRGDPEDGNVDLDELILLSCPAYYSLLFQDEKDLVDDLWGYFIAETSASVTDIPVQPTYDLASEDVSTPPTSLNQEPSHSIESLHDSWSSYSDAELKTAAARVQLAYDDDSDPSTISMDDAQNALDDPLNRFDDDAPLITDILIQLHARGETTADARLRVPAPIDADSEVVLATVGSVEFHVVTTIEVRDSRSFQSGAWSVTLQLYHEEEPRFTIPMGTEIVLLRLDERDEELRSGAHFPLNGYEAGEYKIEVWEGDALVFSDRIRFNGAFSDVARHGVELNEYRDFVIEAYSGEQWVELDRNVRETTYTEASQRYGAVFTYDLGPRDIWPSSPPFIQSSVNAVSTPSSGMPAGRYVMPTSNYGNVTIDLYPQAGVVYLHRPSDGLRVRLDYTASGLTKLYNMTTGGPDPYVAYFPGGDRVTFSPPNPSEEIFLAPEMREK